MTWISEDDFGIPFPDTVKADGRRLIEDGDVQLLEGSTEDFYEARVRFFRRHQEVWIERKNGQVEHDCTCPVLQNSGHGCAHLWALFLEIERTRQQEETDQAGGLPPILPYWVLHVEARQVRLAAHWTGEDESDLRPLPIDAEHLNRIEDDAHQRVIALLLPLAGGKRNLIDGGGFADPDGPWELPPENRDGVLAAAHATDRLVSLPDNEPAVPVELDLSPPMELVLGFADDPGRDRLRLSGWLVRGDLSIPLDGCPQVAAGPAPAAIHQGRLFAIDTLGADDWLHLLASEKDYPVARDEAASVLSGLAASGALPRVAPPGQPPLPLQTGTPVARLRVTRQRSELVADLAFAYDNHEVTPESAARTVLDLDAGHQWRRDPPAEEALARDLDDREGLVPDEGTYGRWWVDPQQFETTAISLLEDGVEVFCDGRPWRCADPPSLTMVTGRDWFDLKGGVAFAGAETVSLPDVLRALRDGRRFVELQDGGKGLLPAAWVERIRPVLELGQVHEDRLRFHRAQAAYLEPLSGSGIEIDGDGLSEVLHALEVLADPPKMHPPATFVGELRSYQERGLGWLRTLAASDLGGCLADDMGLGKTVQVLALLRSLEVDPPEGWKPGPVLLVVPRSLLFNWRAECARFTPGLVPYLHHGTHRRREADDVASESLVLTTYGTLLRDIGLLSAIPWAAAILDEAQAVKNPRSRAAQAARQLDARLRLSLTGTPVENHARDLWAQMDFLNPGLLGNERKFLAAASRGGTSRAILARALRPLVLRRTKEEVAKDLPPRIEQTVLTTLSAEQEALYARLRDEAAARLANTLESSERLHVLESLLRLRQIACHPGLVDPSLVDAPSGKIDLLVDELDQVVRGGHKALVFSQFTKLLSIVRRRLDPSDISYGYLDGSTRDREAVVRDFQEDAACSVLLVSLKAGGHGLNLTAADYVFLLDPWWNPAVESQAIDRAHRIGREHTVVATRLVARGTVEEKILDLQAEKRKLAEDLIGEARGPLQTLTQDDLRMLLS